jgi:hypothetical protein
MCLIGDRTVANALYRPAPKTNAAEPSVLIFEHDDDDAPLPN